MIWVTHHNPGKKQCHVKQKEVCMPKMQQLQRHLRQFLCQQPLFATCSGNWVFISPEPLLLTLIRPPRYPRSKPSGSIWPPFQNSVSWLARWTSAKSERRCCKVTKYKYLLVLTVLVDFVFRYTVCTLLESVFDDFLLLLHFCSLHWKNTLLIFGFKRYKFCPK